MDGRAGAVALNVRQMLSPPREACVPKSPAPVATNQADNASAKLATVTDTRNSSPTPGFAWPDGESPCVDLISSKEHLREQLVIAEARVAAAASANTRAAHMAAHLRDMLSPQATSSTAGST